MSRRRYLSTDISTDDKINALSDRAALLYTWSLPHFTDDCRITPQNAAEFKMAVIPGRCWTVDEVEKALEEIFSLGLWGRDENNEIFIPAESFYKFQTYVNAAKRRKTPPITANHRRTPKNTSSPSPSPSLKEDKSIMNRGESRGGKNKSAPKPELSTELSTAPSLNNGNGQDPNHSEDPEDELKELMKVAGIKRATETD